MSGNISQSGNLKASISAKGTLSGTITSRGTLSATVSKPAFLGGEEYEGAYEVTPKVEAQTMPTKYKLLTDDMTVKAIPFFNVSNTSGGSTVFIGNEV